MPMHRLSKLLKVIIAVNMKYPEVQVSHPLLHSAHVSRVSMQVRDTGKLLLPQQTIPPMQVKYHEQQGARVPPSVYNTAAPPVFH
jgi:hypothetical protein